MMKRLCILAVSAIISTVALAQTATDADLNAEKTAIFGYFSYGTVLNAMPEMAAVKAKMQKLRSQYDAEMQRAEDEFNKKYEDFLEGQRSFEPSIFKKRQAELTDMMQKNMAFKEEAVKLLAQAEEEAMKPLKKRLAEAVAAVGKRLALAFVLNADNDALPYVDSVLGQDVTAAVLNELK
jgi:outer membrane protein